MIPIDPDKQIEANIRAIEEARKVRKRSARPFATLGSELSGPWQSCAAPATCAEPYSSS